MEAVVFLLMSGGLTLFLMSFTPIGRAYAERLRARSREADPDLIAEVDTLRREVAELQERMDFAERLLTQEPEPKRIER